MHNKSSDRSKPLILLTNDDGYFSQGLQALFQGLKDLGDLYIVAPDEERSASSLSLSLRRPLKTWKIDDRITAVSGTPADCIYMALQKILPRKPDLLISGINHGPNLGRQDVSYSGTVGAALQGAFLGIPSIAVSVLPDKAAEFPFEFGAGFIARLGKALLSNTRCLYPESALNINIPPPPIQGIKVTKLGHKRYNPEIITRDEDKEPSEYWIGPGTPKAIGDADSDVIAIQKGFITITPLHTDRTDFSILDQNTLADVVSSLKT